MKLSLLVSAAILLFSCAHKPASTGYVAGCPLHDSLLSHFKLTDEFSVTDSSEVIYLEDVFGPNVEELNKKAKLWLDSLAQKTDLFSRYDKATIIMFDKDPISSETYSTNLPRIRAGNIKKYLYETGIDASMIFTMTRGTAFPVTDKLNKQYQMCLGSNIYIKFIK